MSAWTGRRAVVGALLAGVLLSLPAIALPASMPQDPAPNAAVHARIAVEKAAIEDEIARALRTLRIVDPEDDVELYQESEVLLAERLVQYREVLTAELAARLAEVPQEQWAGVTLGFRRDVMARWAGLLSGVRAGLVANLGRVDEDAARARAEIYAEIEAAVYLNQVGLEVAGEAYRRLEPVFDDGRRRYSSSVARLQELIGDITADYIEAPNTFLEIRDRDQRALTREIDVWLKQLVRRLRVQEFLRIADGALIVDPRTGEPLSRELRQRVGRNAKLELIAELRDAGADDSVLRSVFRWSDSRESLATLLESQVQNNDWYRALDFLEPDTAAASPERVFRVLALVVQRDVQELLDWRAQLIPEGDDGSILGPWREFLAKQEVGLGLARMIDSDTGTVGEIDAQLETLQADADAVTSAFLAAADTARPEELSDAHHQLLETHGFIAIDEAAVESYQFPTGSVTARLRSGLDLPGASLLDAISGKNAIKTVLLVFAPQLIAGRVAVLLEGLELSGAAITFGTVATEVAVGASLSAAEQYAIDGRVQFDQVLLDSLLVGPASQVVELAGNVGSRALARYLLANPAARAAAAASAAQAIGLSSEAAIQAYWSASVQGRGVSYEEFLANLVNGAIGRGAPALGSGYATVGRVLFRHDAAFPAWLNQGLNDIGANGAPRYPDLIAEVGTNNARLAQLDANFVEAEARFRRVLGDGAGELHIADDLIVTRVTRALESGELSWNDLKLVFTDAPTFLTPLLQAINVKRRQLFDGIVAEAQSLARFDLLGEQIHRRREVFERFPGDSPEDSAARTRELRTIDRWYNAELELINQKVIAPGSDNLTSDIDRSVASPRVRNALKWLTDRAFASDNPATSARAYDVNEYINVFLVINRQRDSGVALAGVEVADSNGLTHAQAVEASGFAHAMLHMTPRERARFGSSLLANAPDVATRARLGAQLDYAAASLARGEAALVAELARIGADPGNPTPDDVLRARDNLYGETVFRLREWERRLTELDPASPEYADLAALIEREWAVTLREGIEAYSDFTGLDIIVTEGQIQDRSARDLLDDESFTAASRDYTPEQLNGALYNQLGMIVEHAHAFHLGEEGAVTATAAVGKYAERAVLLLKLQGLSIIDGPRGTLNTVAAELVANRKDPEALRAVLRRFGGGSEDAGFVRLLGLIERSIPSATDLFTRVDPGLLRAHGFEPPSTLGRGDPGARLPRPTPVQRARAEAARQRERQLDDERDEREDGIDSVIRRKVSELEGLLREQRALSRELSRRAWLEGWYRREDIANAVVAERRRDAIQAQIDLLPRTPGAGGSTLASDLRDQLRAVRAELAKYRQNLSERGPNDGVDEQAFADQLRLDQIEGEIARLEDELDELVDRAREQQRLIDEEPVVVPAGFVRLSYAENFAPAPGLGPFSPFASDLVFPENPFDPLATTRSTYLPPDTIGFPSPSDSIPRDAGGAPGDPPRNPDGSPDDSARDPGAGGDDVTVPPEGGAVGGDAGDDGTGSVPGDGRIRSRVPPLSYGWGPREREEDDEDPPLPTEPVFVIDPRQAPPELVSWPRVTDPRTQLMIIESLDDVQVILGLPAGSNQGDGSRPEASLVSFSPTVLSGRGPLAARQEEQAPVVMVLASLGESTGEAFAAAIVNTGPRPVAFDGVGIVVEPLDEAARSAIEQSVADLPLDSAVTARLSAYCLEFLKLPPSAGTLFRIAPAEVQQQFAPMRDVLRAARLLEELGLLNPDSDPRGYVDSIKQWALWSKEASLDYEGFVEQFVDHSRDNFEGLGREWTEEIEGELRAAAPGRWQDIERVLRYADSGR